MMKSTTTPPVYEPLSQRDEDEEKSLKKRWQEHEDEKEVSWHIVI